MRQNVMRCLIGALATGLSLAGECPGDEPIQPTDSSKVRLDGQTFTIPTGWIIERVAGSPLVDRPIVADFDHRGRLYVADSSGSNAPVKEQLANPTHRIVRLEDTNGDGHFDRSTIFADKMMFPEGTLWHAGSLFVSAPPQIWRLTDDDDDGRADRREVWVDGQTLTGCANDLHGPYLGRDGWIYWCKGAFAEQTWDQGTGKPPLKSRAAHVFRKPLVGGTVEPVMTGGMDNPVELVFTPSGERIITTTFLQRPGGGKRDGLLHVIYGGLYGKVNDVIDPHPHTSPDLMPVLDHLGPAAPSGLALIESDILGPGYRGSLLSAQFNMHKIGRHLLEPDGATFRTIDFDLLVSDSIDFHPTDVLEDADGSILVLNTGGWYRLCCPTSSFEKADLLGAVYRLRRQGAPAVEDPRGLKLGDHMKQPATLVSDPRPAVRQRAWQRLGSDPEGLLALNRIAGSSESGSVRAEAVWAIARAIASTRERAAAETDVAKTTEQFTGTLRFALKDPDSIVRGAAAHVVGLERIREALPELHSLLSNPSLSNRRAAAEAIGRIGDKSSVPPLLSALESANSDRVLIHSLTYALIEIGDAGALAENLEIGSAARRAAVSMAIAAIDPSRLVPERVARDLDDPDENSRRAAAWIMSRHPEWGEALTGVLRNKLSHLNSLTETQRTQLIDQLARFASAPGVREVIGRALEPGGDSKAREMALRAIEHAGAKPIAPEWESGLVKALLSADAQISRLALLALRGKLADPASQTLVAALRQFSRNSSAAPADRVDALAELGERVGPIDVAELALLRDELVPERPVRARLAAVDVLSKAKLSREQRLELSAELRRAGPLELERLLTCFEPFDDIAVGRAMIAALRESPGLSSLAVDTLRKKLLNYGDALGPDAADLLAKLIDTQTERRAKLDRLSTQMGQGDIRRGFQVFQSAKAACSSCHAIGYLGGTIGPDLSRIGQIRSDRDLLEAIVEPSATFVRSYEPWIVATNRGQIHSGILKSDGPDGVILTVDARTEVTVPRDEIEEMRPGTVSVMPSGLDQQLSPAELADLIAFLKSAK